MSARVCMQETSTDLPGLLRLPPELLSCVVQFLVRADDFQDYLSLSRTCKDLYATLWTDSADMWKIVWKTLYDDTPEVADQTENENLHSALYKESIKSRMRTLQLTRGIATKLGQTTRPSEQDDPDLYQGGYKKQQRKKTRKQAYALSPGAYLKTMTALVNLAHGLGDKNAHWIQIATTSEFWAHAIHLWFSKSTVGGGPLRACHEYHEPATLCKLFDILAKVATTVPVIPSWFNQGIKAISIKPIPLIPPFRSRSGYLQQRVHQERSQRTKGYVMSGRWTGYYAYQIFVPHVNAVLMDDEDDVVSDYDSDGDDSAAYESDDLELDEERPLRSGITRGQEYAVRGLKVDRRMIVDLVDGTMDWLEPYELLVGRAAASQDPKRSEPLYLSSDIDARVLAATDKSFLRRVESREFLADEDDLDDRSNWGHQRVFSGRGQDAIGEFGIRGIVSEQTGLVRMIKTYFSASQLEVVRGMQFFEFGNQPHQLPPHPRTVLLRWSYRGHVDPDGEGPGILGLWYDNEVYTPGTLVYEVNLSVPREKVEEYIDWLRGFTKAYGLHWLSEEGNNKTYITVHYVIESQAHLEAYLEKEQPAVAAAEQERFEFLVTSRRTLSVVF
ncbi:hypothetical protein BGZ70_009915 [Mortierella alpina]|uniref:F-box domain-containing protein n=1 Tax=Mortierella alpina TaxID=64518 RepID=A0A9P6J3J4_MORAP|nr:hypothetical protein BGZ70_009915 [Mortierella alpina]